VFRLTRARVWHRRRFSVFTLALGFAGHSRSAAAFVLCLSPTAPPCSDAPLRALRLALRSSPATAPSVCLFSPSGAGFPQPALGFRAAVVFTSRRVPHWSLGHFSTESSTGAESSIGHSFVRVLVRFSNLNQSLCYGPRASIIGFVYFRFHFFISCSVQRPSV
jgi:hypothetical protein